MFLTGLTGYSGLAQHAILSNPVILSKNWPVVKARLHNVSRPLGAVLFAVLLGSARPTFADIHYVNVASATPAAPYITWGTAAKVIQNAIDSATNGDTVLVADGIYSNGGLRVYGA
jgi:hypothetical protein